MPKNIVVCCDGTGNQYGYANSNVVKLYWTLSAQDKQVAYYHPGVGTMGARNALSAVGKWWTKVRGLAFGYGFSDNIADVYSFLMREFNPGDQIYIFGFSRGAYTARALCGLLHMCGLLTPGNEGLIPYALRLYKSNDPCKFEIAAGFATTFSIPCKPYFLGLWDTVSSVGWILDPIHTKGGHLPYTAALPDVSVVRHAVSIDERRAFFRQNLVHLPPQTNQNLKEVWFAGVHSDVGGSYAEHESGLSKIALRWMLCEAQSAGLQLDPQKVNDVLGGKVPYVAPNPKGELHKSLHGFWYLGEIWPKRYYHNVAAPGQAAQWKRGIRLNLGSARFIEDGVHLHQSVLERMRDVADYRPKNLPQQYVAEQENSCELAPRPLIQQPPIAPAKRPLLRRPSMITVMALLALLGLFALAVAVFTIHNSLEVPKIDRPTEVAWLWQNWTDDQRHSYYHTAQGSELLPYAWFLALEQPRLTIGGAPPFKDNSYLQGFGFIPDSSYEQNPDGLPVGFARDDRFVDPYTGQKSVVLGLTCAACHTGELFYGKKAIRIEAGPSLIDLQKFTEAIGLAVTWTYYDPARFRRFANRVLGPNHSHADQVLLRKALKYYLDTSFTEFKSTLHLFPTPEGYGRTDALARIGNFVFGTELNNNKNLVVGDGPVNFPPIWDASWMDWVQYNGSIQQPMGRNVGEALGVRSRINLVGYPGEQFQNTIRVENLREIELLLGGDAPGKGVWSPKWPADVLGKIDLDKAAKGETLYNELCLHCHQPPMYSDEGRKPEHWTNFTNSAGRQFFKVTMIPLAEIGTDPKEAENFARRTADSGPLGKGTIAATEGLKYITQQVIDQAYTELKLSPEQQQEWNGFRENALLAPLKYKARPHNGIWATPPYLHNGSVPNLFALLSPVSERPKVFYLGNKWYDPVKLGLNTDPLKGASEFRTDLPGNSNAGHEFNDGPKGNGVIGRKLSDEERYQIIEYLKTL
ncbi:MAG: DUF2235 domain-containing protein [Acidobacteriia bacterium]|nr:DUF2235 domain-containing protein [Terriglobia bacterium]